MYVLKQSRATQHTLCLHTFYLSWLDKKPSKRSTGFEAKLVQWNSCSVSNLADKQIHHFSLYDMQGAFTFNTVYAGLGNISIYITLPYSSTSSKPPPKKQLLLMSFH